MANFLQRIGAAVAALRGAPSSSYETAAPIETPNPRQQRAMRAIGGMNVLTGAAPKTTGTGKSSGGGSMLPPQEPLKPPKGGGSSIPAWRRAATPSTGEISKKAFDVTNVDLVSSFRTGATTAENVRNFVRISPEMSASMTANNRVGIPERYLAIARNPDLSYSPEGTRLIMQWLRQLNSMPDYFDGFSKVGSLRSVCEALGRSMSTEGAMAVELVLDKNRYPSSFQPIGVSSIVFEEDGNGVKPFQKIGGELIDLDLPTVFYTGVDTDLYDIYPQSPMESAVQPVLAATTFLTDLRRICARHVYPRYEIILDEEIVKKNMPSEALETPETEANYLNSLFDAAETAINDLGVEEALVHYDFFQVKVLEVSGADASETFNTINDITRGKLATSLKTPPSVLGMGASSQTLASSETLMYMLQVDGMIRMKLQEILSKALTLVARLYGLEVSVEFEFDNIDLRAKNELEAYFSMKQSRLLTQLSFGFITDEECCLRLTYQLPPAGYTMRSGTLFPVAPAAAAADNGNNDSTTGNMGKKDTPEATQGSKKK